MTQAPWPTASATDSHHQRSPPDNISEKAFAVFALGHGAVIARHGVHRRPGLGRSQSLRLVVRWPALIRAAAAQAGHHYSVVMATAGSPGCPLSLVYGGVGPLDCGIFL